MSGPSTTEQAASFIKELRNAANSHSVGITSIRVDSMLLYGAADCMQVLHDELVARKMSEMQASSERFNAMLDITSQLAKIEETLKRVLK